MPLLKIPDSGLSFESCSGMSTKSDSTQDIIGLTLTDDMIEEMIQCVQNGKPIQLSLGARPSLSFGHTTQQLSSYQDPFTHELYRTTYPQDYDPSSSQTDKMPGIFPIGTPTMFQKMLMPKWSKEKKAAPSKTTADVAKAVTAGVDAAKEMLEKTLASEKARKEENTTKLIKATLDPKKGALKSGKSKFLSTQGHLNETTRSLPSSPALSGVGSPLVTPTSVPASQLLAEQAKTNRKPIIHLLALAPMSQSALREKVSELSDSDFETALNKVADKDASTNLYQLLKNYYKELDVWTFNYETEEDRQTVIENAIKMYDRMRIPPNDDEWERLKPIENRGDGVSLSKVQARIAQGPIPRTPKINVSTADSGRDTPGRESDAPGNKAISRVKNDTKKRSSSQPPATKAKRVSEKETQSKRLFASKKKTAPAAKKEQSSKANGAKPLSSQFVSESDDEDLANQLAPPPKRAREEEASSDSSQPLSKKPRPSNTYPTSRPLDHYRPADTITVKTKGTSPQKSSPLASSPPTNASEFNSSSSASDSSTPRHGKPKSSRSPIHKRNSSSISTSSSASSTQSYSSKFTEELLQQAMNFRCFYGPYEQLHRKLSAMREDERTVEEQEKLLDMHERLVKMKREIKEAAMGIH